MRGWGALALAAAVAGLIVGTLLFALPAKAGHSDGPPNLHALDERVARLEHVAKATPCLLARRTMWEWSSWSDVHEYAEAWHAALGCDEALEELKR